MQAVRRERVEEPADDVLAELQRVSRLARERRLEQTIHDRLRNAADDANLERRARRLRAAPRHVDELGAEPNDIAPVFRDLGAEGCEREAASMAREELGSEERLEYTLVGDTVNMAQRLQDQARPAGRIVLSEATYAALRAPVDAQRLEPLRVKGREAPVTAYVITAAGGSARADGATPRVADGIPGTGGAA